MNPPIITEFMHIAAIAKRRSERQKLFVCGFQRHSALCIHSQGLCVSFESIDSLLFHSVAPHTFVPKPTDIGKYNAEKTVWIIPFGNYGEQREDSLSSSLSNVNLVYSTWKLIG